MKTEKLIKCDLKFIDSYWFMLALLANVTDKVTEKLHQKNIMRNRNRICHVNRKWSSKNMVIFLRNVKSTIRILKNVVSKY